MFRLSLERGSRPLFFISILLVFTSCAGELDERDAFDEVERVVARQPNSLHGQLATDAEPSAQQTEPSVPQAEPSTESAQPDAVQPEAEPPSSGQSTTDEPEPPPNDDDSETIELTATEPDPNSGAPRAAPDDEAEPDTPTVEPSACPPQRPKSCVSNPIRILQGRACALSSCHGTADEPPSFFLDLAFDVDELALRLAQTAGTGACEGRRVIDVENPEASLLITKLNQELEGPSALDCGAIMPPTPAFRGIFLDTEKQCLIDWVLAEAGCLQ